MSLTEAPVLSPSPPQAPAPKPGYKKTKLGWIPEEWEVLKFKQISESINSGSTPLRSENSFFADGTNMWVKTTDLNNGLIEDSEEYVTDLALKKARLRVFPKNTVLVAMYGGFNQIGRTGMLTRSSSINQALAAIEVETNKALPIYLLMWLNFGVGYWTRYAASSRKDPNITKKDVEDFLICIPPLPEQQKIAEILSTWDESIAKTEALLAQKQQLKKGLMQQLLTGKKRFAEFIKSGKTTGDEVPTGWKRLELGKFVSKPKGKYNPKSSSNSLPCIELEHLQSETGQLLGSVDSRLQKSIKNKFSTGQVLYGKLRPYLKKYWLAKFEGVCSSEIWALQGVKDECLNHFLYYLIQTHEFNQLANQTSGSKMPRADWDHIVEFPFLVPSIEEQQKIASVLSAADVEIATLQAQLFHLRAQKKGLMQRLLTGELRVKIN